MKAFLDTICSVAKHSPNLLHLVTSVGDLKSQCCYVPRRLQHFALFLVSTQNVG